MDTNPIPPPPPPPARKLNWFLFFAVLLAPAVLALIGAMANVEGLAVGGPVFGGGIAGIICGVMLARRVPVQSAAQVALGFVFVAVMGLLSFALGFGGCMVGGFQMHFQ